MSLLRVGLLLVERTCCAVGWQWWGRGQQGRGILCEMRRGQIVWELRMWRVLALCCACVVSVCVCVLGVAVCMCCSGECGSDVEGHTQAETACFAVRGVTGQAFVRSTRERTIATLSV